MKIQATKQEKGFLGTIAALVLLVIGLSIAVAVVAKQVPKKEESETAAATVLPEEAFGLTATSEGGELVVLQAA